jgi:hypothetical protein
VERFLENDEQGTDQNNEKETEKGCSTIIEDLMPVKGWNSNQGTRHTIS